MASIRLNPVAGHGYGSIYVDSIIWGGRLWDPSTPINVWFGDPDELEAAYTARGDAGYMAELDPSTLQAWDVDNYNESQAFLYTINLYSSVCGLKFNTRTTVQDADIVWWKISLAPLGGTVVGMHETLENFPNSTKIWGYFSPEVQASWGHLTFGGDGLNTVIHEIGHALGLAHPHDGGGRDDATTFPGVNKSTDLGTNNLNQSVYTVMSYNPGLAGTDVPLAYGNQGGLGAFDIAALQALYGVNNTTATGDNEYKLPTVNDIGTGWMCIWDAGGDDTISAVDATDSVIIDLRSATLADGDAFAGGFTSQQNGIAGGFTIAKGAEIENAVGGSKSDELYGNAKNNSLVGNDGNDYLSAYAGNDTLVGGFGDDELAGGAGADELDGGDGFDIASYAYATAGVVVHLGGAAGSAGDAQDDTFISIEGVIGSDFDDAITGTGIGESLSGGKGADFLVGGGGGDTLLGGLGDDTLEAGSGVDELDGGDGTDIVSYAHASAGVVLNLGSAAGSSGDALNDTFMNIEGVLGSDHADRITGTDKAEILAGGGGADTLIGGLGDDVYIIEGANDQITELANGGKDTIITSGSASLASFANCEVLMASSGAAAITLGGSTGNDKLVGNDGSNTLDGGGGTDTLEGGAGDDTYILRSAAEQVTDTSGNDTAIVSFNYTLTAGSLENLTGSGTAALALTGNAAANVITTGAGGGTLEGGGGSDTLNGGQGFDLASYAHSASGLLINLADTNQSTGEAKGDKYTSIEGINGSNFGDTIGGTNAAESLDGGKGDDLLFGGGGTDTLVGGFGDDSLEGGAGADKFDGGDGTDLASYAQSSVGLEINLANASLSTGEAQGDTFANIEGVIGSNFNDTITGTDRAELLIGGAGADSLIGGGGDDVYVVDNPNDVVVEAAGGGYDTVITAQSISLAAFANCEALVASSGSGAIALTGNSGNNKLSGNDGANTLNGGGGIDTLEGGAGDDTYFLSSAADQVVDISGNDTAVVSFSYTLVDSLENLKASGSSAINLTGNALNNVIIGNDGANLINGGLGKDTLSGGAGQDTFVFSTRAPAGGADIIADFNVADDTIDLAKAAFSKLKIGKLSAAAYWTGTKAHDSSDRIIYNKKNGYVYYDADGTGKAKAEVVVILNAGLKMTNKDFFVI